MDDLRELDARCAELLGWHNIKQLSGDVCGQPQYSSFDYSIPRYSFDPTACAEMDKAARQEGYTLYLWYDRHGVWTACYLREGERPNWLIWQFGDTEWEARTKAYIAVKERQAKSDAR